MTENNILKIQSEQSAESAPNTQGAQKAQPLSPNVLQSRASNPQDSVWVDASAGTGKTKVLTDRVLRLLLPRSDQEGGTPPHKILCLTYTKAAASEMSLRIGGILERWAVMPERRDETTPPDQKTLAEELESLTGKPASPFMIAAARRLFAQIMDTPGGLKIMTIHSFCQSLLGRFPLEAGIRPNMTGLEESGAARYLEAACKQVFKKAQQEKTSPLGAAFENIAATLDQDSFTKLLKAIVKERRQLEKILGQTWDVDGLYTRLCQYYDLKAEQTPSQMLREFCADDALPLDDLRESIKVLADSKTKGDTDLRENLQAWLEMDLSTRCKNPQHYFLNFLTKSFTPRANVVTKKYGEKFPHITEFLNSEQQRVIDFYDRLNCLQCVILTRDLFTLSVEIIKAFQALKAQDSVLDFDDLILLTLKLLKGESADLTGQAAPMAQWIHYKLDQGIDHILIDEAQDTNPEQWEIIEALSADFFSGENARGTLKRTIFTVGDKKQSIYSFQRASPESFDKMRQDYERALRACHDELVGIPLQTSFRSTHSVLEAVDLVFSQEGLRTDPGFENIEHIAYRGKDAGLVDIWPLFETEKDDSADIDFWQPVKEEAKPKSASMQCAEFIAAQIAESIQSDEDFEKIKGRKIRAGDFMILVRTRSAFVNQMIRALKEHNIPVAGHDRMVLKDQIAVQDLLALADFAIFPDDDLTLACLLKSPLIGLGDDDLTDLCVNRTGSLWQSLKAKAQSGTAPLYQNAATYLEEFMREAARAKPYEFLNRALMMPCPTNTVSGLRAMQARLGHDVAEPLDELLNAALRFESEYAPVLQHFIHWQNSGEADIKRESDESADEVRIMTIHSAKGLQAPIVILPDTTSSFKKGGFDEGRSLLWPHKTGKPLPIFAPRKEFHFERFREDRQIIDDRAMQEWRRLLYVALTRAEDRLYITGYSKGKGKKSESAKQASDTPKESWYQYCLSGLGGKTSKHGDITQNEHGLPRLFNPQLGEPQSSKDAKENHSAQDISATAPAWLFAPAPPEPSPSVPLLPSRPSMDEPSALSPLYAQDNFRFLRGNITHKLLQFLPDMPPEKREDAALNFTARFGSDLPQAAQSDIVRECFAILEHPEFKPLFSPQSRAEVPITGLLGGKDIISGQIDRLYIDPAQKTIWIVDYKTNRPPPLHADDVPLIYHNQLRLYRDTLQAVYPDFIIKCALLWTDGPRLMPIALD
ncbi:MAG: double-strand break repair helicase AddA [Alphaproteobacteria bacterium]